MTQGNNQIIPEVEQAIEEWLDSTHKAHNPTPGPTLRETYVASGIATTYSTVVTSVPNAAVDTEYVEAVDPHDTPTSSEEDVDEDDDEDHEWIEEEIDEDGGPF